MTKIKEVCHYLETIAPSVYQESYDNSGLLTGNSNEEVTGVLTCLDCTEDIVEEAIKTDCNLIIAHHPIIFSGLKRLTGRTYIERTIIKAIKNDIAIYACHTNLDNVLTSGVNQRIGHQLGLEAFTTLVPKTKALTYQIKVSSLLKPELLTRLKEITSGHNFEDGNMLVNRDEDVSLTVPKHLKREVEHACGAFKAHFVKVQSEANFTNLGGGLVARLPLPMSEVEFLQHVKKAMGLDCLKHTSLLGKSVDKVAICGGSGGFMLPYAKASGAQVFITADYKYHEYFDADGDIIILDIGHFESERYTIDLLKDLVQEKFSTFASRKTEIVTNPIHYLT